MAGKKILVADDSLTIQKVIRLALSGDGYEIQTISDGQDAVEQASLFRPDICIIDVSLPTKDAYQIRQEFMSKPDLKNIPVIMMSSAFEKVDEQRMGALGFAGHLVKPFDPSHLRSTLLAVSNQTPKTDPIEESISISGTDLPPLHMDHSGDDIQQLTKSTFDMSGLDQQDWGVIEPMKEDVFTVSENTVQMSVPSSFQSISPVVQQQIPVQQQTPAQQQAPTQKTTQQQQPLAQQPVFQQAAGNMEQAPHYSTASPTITYSQDNLEGIINGQVEKMLESMKGQISARIQEIFDQEYKHYTQAKMPEMAEKVIKEEIHKLLSDPPV